MLLVIFRGALTEFAVLVGKSSEIEAPAIVVDVREGQTLDRLPEILKQVKQILPTRVVFSMPGRRSGEALLETRRPHPLRRSETVERSIVEERNYWTRSECGRYAGRYFKLQRA